MSNVLRLTLKKRWYDEIRYGSKREEYREIKPYWTKRLEGKKYNSILFVNGYSSTARRFEIECLDICRGTPKQEWYGSIPDKETYIIKLGDII